MNIELNKNNNVDKSGQFQINFEANNKEEDSFKKERSEVAQKYGVLNLDLIKKVNNQWTISGLSLDEWEDLNGKDEKYWNN